MTQVHGCDVAPAKGAHTHEHNGHHHHGHDHGHDMADDPQARSKLFWAGVLTGGFMLAEIAGGLVSGSLALLADAAHMLSDTASLWLAWYAIVLAARPADVNKTFGMHRAKVVVAYTNGLALFAVIGWIVYEAVGRLLTPSPILAGTMLTVAVVGLCVNILCFWLLHRGGDSLNVRGARLHVLGDLLGSIAAIAAAGIIWLTGWTLADPLLSLLVAGLLLRSALTLTRQSLHILLQGTPAGLDLPSIRQSILENVAGLKDVHHLHAWSLDDSRPIVTLHAVPNPEREVDQVVAAIKQHLSEAFHITHATVEVEYETCADRQV